MADIDKTAILPNGNSFVFWETSPTFQRELHVNATHPFASDESAGTPESPYKTIRAAAKVATPGTRIWIHGGEYRETVQPARGGTDPENMISYEAVPGESVVVKASVVADQFKPSQGWRLSRKFPPEPAPAHIKIWETALNPEDFKGYNPFCAVNILHDRLFIEYEKTDMTTYLNRRGMVFVDGEPLQQVPLYNQMAQQEGSYWVEANGQKVHMRLSGDDSPENHLIELTSREQCFVPFEPFQSFIKVKGITFAHAATGAPVPQRGAISCYRGHHWIIEDCTIDWSNAVGIDCGNECWHHEMIQDQMLGHTILRRNTIRDAGVCGIAGMFISNLLIEDNLIEGTGWQRMELSWEAGGIKVHNAKDCLFRRNVIRRNIGCDALWMDVANENCRITSNLFLDGIDSREHLFIECTKDEENLIDNNVIWNVEGRFDRNAVKTTPGSTGWYRDTEEDLVNGYGIYLEGTDRLRMVHNLIGKCNKAGFFAKVVAFRLMMKRGGTSRENKIFNNVFHECGEAAIILPNEHNEAEGNVYGQMPPGFLRVMYPQPEMCLDLQTWQEFCGFDQEGAITDMDIEIDTDTLVMTLQSRSSLPKSVSQPCVTTDFFGNDAPADRVAGPFTVTTGSNVQFSIDPRRLQTS